MNTVGPGMTLSLQRVVSILSSRSVRCSVSADILTIYLPSGKKRFIAIPRDRAFGVRMLQRIAELTEVPDWMLVPGETH